MSERRKHGVQVIGAMLIALAMSIPSWAHDFPLAGSSQVPAASGAVSTSKDRNGNTKVEVKVKNLALPSKLVPPATTYVVWFQQPDSAPESEGVLTVNGHLDGEFRTTTPWRLFRVLITAETDRLAKAPSGPPLLATTVEP